MSDQLVNAVFEGGSFRPLEPLHINLYDGDRVRLRVESPGTPTLLDLAAKVYDGLLEGEIDEIEQIAMDRSNFFRGRDDE
jgi:predicted DNA-binding antitoxin AbrB/MazE fold protein